MQLVNRKVRQWSGHNIYTVCEVEEEGTQQSHS